jgi:predicted permease
MFREWLYALRLLGKTPGFSLLTVFVFAAGFGLSVYMYVLIKMFAYGDLPFPEADRVVAVDSVVNGVEAEGGTISYYDYKHFAERQDSFDLFFPGRAEDVILAQEGIGQRVVGNYVTEAMFELTGEKPMLGRALAAADLRPGAAPVALISYRLWQREFAGDPEVIGRTVRMNDKPTTIVGIMPDGFRFPLIAELWLPFVDPGVLQPGAKPNVQIYGRLKEGVGFGQANRALGELAKELAEAHPETNHGHGVKVWPFAQVIMANSMSMIGVMIVATAFILLLVCANVANLLLARAGERQKELAIRAALGAPRSRLVRQMLMESLSLAAAGGLLGLFCAAWAMEWSRGQIESMGEDIPFWWNFSLSWGTVGFAAVLVLGVGLLVGLLPALRASGGDLATFLRDGTRGALGRRLTRFTRAMVGLEILLCATLLISSGVLVRSMYLSINADFGAPTQGVLYGNITLKKEHHVASAASVARFAEQVRNELMANLDPQTDAATVSNSLPGMSSGSRTPVLSDQMDPGEKQLPRTIVVTALPGYFKASGIGLLDGREFGAEDDADSLGVAVVNDSFAKQFWPNQSALGKRFKLNPQDTASPWLTVVGISEQVLHGPPFEENRRKPAVYLPLAQNLVTSLIVSVRSPNRQSSELLVRSVERIDSDVPLWRVQTLEEQLARSSSGMRFVSQLFLAFALLALLLAGSGIYAITARSVVLRTHEIGVRRALGADRRDIFMLLFSESGKQLAIGGGIGLLIGAGLVMLLSTVLYNFNSEAPFLFAGVIAILATVVGLATWLPARHAVRIPPNRALHYE